VVAQLDRLNATIMVDALAGKPSTNVAKAPVVLVTSEPKK
jgi:hypothetical protein